MKPIRTKTLALVFALLMAFSLSACAGTATPSATPAPSSAAPVAETSAPASEAPTASEAPAETPDATGDAAFSKYDPPITISVIRTLDDTTKFITGEDISNNPWAKLYLDELGITFKYEWTASTAQQYDDKLNVNIASGSLPDMLGVNRSQLARLAKTELINKDLGAAYEQYASPFLKQIMTQEGTTALDSATFGGKLVATPNTGSSMDGAPLIWIRQDWLDKLSLKAPATIDELTALIDAFTTKDPEGNGGPYYGLALTKDLYNGFGGFEGICNAFHAYPGIWVKDASGKLVQGSYQPEMKAALQYLQTLYKNGKIDKEFAVKDAGKESELCVSGKIGIQFGQMWNPLWPLQSNIDNNNKADWVSYALPSVDGTPANPQINLGTTSYYVVNKNFANPEAIFKLQSIFVQKGWDSTIEDYQLYFNLTKDGTLYETFKYSFAQAWPATKNLDIHKAIVDAVKSGDTSKLNPEQKTNYTTAQSYRNGDPKGWGMYRVFDEGGSFRIIDQYVSGNLMKMNAFYGADTATMTTKSSALSKLELETFTKIIMGDPIENFDKFVTSAMSLGGSAIQQEVNEWYAANAK